MMSYALSLRAKAELERRRRESKLRWAELANVKTPHPKQAEFVECAAKRIVVKAGRRGGKTVGVGIRAVKRFMAGRRQLYAAPTAEQIDAFWFEVVSALQPAIDAGYLYKNETEHVIEVPGTKQRIRAKTAWNADTLRGDYADDLYLDEWQLMDETAWTEVGAPMLLDTNGDAVFVFTPPSIRTRSTSKARDKKHALKLFKKASEDTSGRYAAFHFTSRDNPHINAQALAEIAADMTSLAYRQEVLAEDVQDVDGALWKFDVIDAGRIALAGLPDLQRVVVAVDPAVTNTDTSDETGIVAAGAALVNGVLHGYVLEDASLRASPDVWARKAVNAYHEWEADRLVAETNNGGDMVRLTIRTVDKNVSYKEVHASRGKVTRAEPIAALYEQGRVHHVGTFAGLEDQMCSWTPESGKSPDRVDALVWALSELMLKQEQRAAQTGRR